MQNCVGDILILLFAGKLPYELCTPTRWNFVILPNPKSTCCVVVVTVFAFGVPQKVTVVTRSTNAVMFSTRVHEYLTPSVSVSLSLSLYLSLCLSSLCVSLSLCLYLSVSLCVSVSLSLSLRVSVCLSLSLFIYVIITLRQFHVHVNLALAFMPPPLPPTPSPAPPNVPTNWKLRFCGLNKKFPL